MSEVAKAVADLQFPVDAVSMMHVLRFVLGCSQNCSNFYQEVMVPSPVRPSMVAFPALPAFTDGGFALPIHFALSPFRYRYWPAITTAARIPGAELFHG